jgi:Serine/threonine protein kinase
MATSILKEYFRGYEILGELGRGNARVLKARSKHTGELVAIKHFAFNTDADTLRRFQRESEIMKSIRHDNIVRIIEVRLDAELPFIVMQLVEGGDLRSLLKRHGSLDVITTLRLAHQMVEALRAIHAKSVVHRDIKPENIMYRRNADGQLQFLLTDFGIAKLREQTQTVTVTGSSMLTYDYASPEQFNQSKSVAAPTDYYSLGVVLYECLTGKVPFEHEEDGLLMHINRVISAPPPLPRTPDGSMLPPALLELLQGLLEKQSIYRLCDPVSIVQLLKRAAAQHIQGPPPVSMKKTAVYIPATKKTTAGKRDVTFTAGLLLLIGMAVFFSWTTLHTNASQRPGVQEKRYSATNEQQDTNKDTELTDELLPRKSLIIPAVQPALLSGTETTLAEGPNPGIELINGIYFNDFSNTQDSLWSTGSDEYSDYRLEDGKYIIQGLADSLSYSASVKFHLDTQKDFVVTANTVHWGVNTGNPYGISFCGDEEQDACYIFYITCDGYYSIGASIKGAWQTLADWTPSSNIHGSAELNVLSVEKRADSLRLLINGRLEKVLPFPGSFGNYFGFRVDGAQTISFDQLIVKGEQ